MKTLSLIPLLFLAMTHSLIAQPIISTVAGSGTNGYSGDNGPATSAAMNVPNAVFIDPGNNIFIADQFNNVIRKVDAATNVITTIVGTGMSGYSGDNGDATNAKLYWPMDVFVDKAGNIFIADAFNHAIRKVAVSSNTITSIAGTGTSGYTGDGGPATAAELYLPNGIYGDTLGSIYFSEYGNNVVRKIDGVTGIISTIAGTGAGAASVDDIPATTAALNKPAGLYVDDSLHLYIADVASNRIRKVSAITGLISTVAGTGISGYSGDDGPASNADLSNPSDIFMDKRRNLLIADVSNHRIRRVDHSTGIIITVAGDGSSGYSGDGFPATNAQLWGPSGVHSDTAGYMYIADGGNNVIRKVEAETTLASDNLKSGGFSIYPNPVIDVIKVVSPDNGGYDVIIIDVLGKQIVKRAEYGHSCSIDVSEFPRGSYWLILAKKGKKTTIQITLQDNR